VTFGAAPVALYEGPTGRRALTGQPPVAAMLAPAGELREEPCGSGREGESLGNVSRGETRCTFVNEIVGLQLALSMFPQVLDFPGDAVLRLVQRGLYRKGWRTGPDAAAPRPDEL
jgi:hypothetical protein